MAAFSNVTFSAVAWLCEDARTATVKGASLQLSHHKFGTDLGADWPFGDLSCEVA